MSLYMFNIPVVFLYMFCCVGVVLFSVAYPFPPTISFPSLSLSPLPYHRCFMSVIMQALIHNPILRNFFLSDLHNSTQCTCGFEVVVFHVLCFRSHCMFSCLCSSPLRTFLLHLTGKLAARNLNSKGCMGCDMDVLMNEVGSRCPFRAFSCDCVQF